MRVWVQIRVRVRVRVHRPGSNRRLLRRCCRLRRRRGAGRSCLAWDVAADGTPRASRSAPPRRVRGARGRDGGARSVEDVLAAQTRGGTVVVLRLSRASALFGALALVLLARELVEVGLDLSHHLRVHGGRGGRFEVFGNVATTAQTRAAGTRPRTRAGVEVSSSRPPPPFRSARCFVGSRPGGSGARRRRGGHCPCSSGRSRSPSATP